MTNSIQHRFFYPHPPKDVWEYLTNAALIAQWLMPNDFEPIPGYDFQFKTQPMPKFDFDGIIYCRVLEIIPFKKLSYSWKGGPGNRKITLDSVVEWTLTSNDNGTELILVHSGFKEIEDFNMYSIMDAGWLKNIKIIETLLNKKINQLDFSCSITANISIKEAGEGINNVSVWWATHVTGLSQNLHDVFTVRFGKTFSTIKIIELVPGKKILWHVIDSLVPLFKNEKQWNNTKMLWEISTENNAVQINFTHIGLTPETECYTDCVAGWSYFVKESLFKLLTEGKGLPRTGITAYIISEGRRYDGLLYYKNDPLPDYTEEYIYLAVKETNGEEVVSIYSAGNYQKEFFDLQQLQGEYFMIVENKSLYQNVPVFQDIISKMND